MNFQAKLDAIVAKNNSLVCVGLDQADYHKNVHIINQTHDLVCAYKPNSAFYEARGDQGVRELKLTCDYLREQYPNIPIILDAKRADIGSTNEGYVRYAFDWLGVDAITLNPYPGQEALKPFLDYKDKGCIFWCRTSNPGAAEFQDLLCDGKPLWQHIAEHISQRWNSNGNCLLVVGATYPDELTQIRQIVGNMTLLIPGIGAQGGDIKTTVTAGQNSQGAGMIINSSRGIIFASNPRQATQTLKDAINQHRHHS